MTQQLRVHTAFAEDVYLVPVSRLGSSDPGRLDASALPGHMHSYTHTQTHACTLNQSDKNLIYLCP